MYMSLYPYATPHYTKHDNASSPSLQLYHVTAILVTFMVQKLVNEFHSSAEIGWIQ